MDDNNKVSGRPKTILCFR